MKHTKILMGMPITVEILGDSVSRYIEEVFSYFKKIDARFSTYKPNSEISKVNRGLPKYKWSDEMKLVLDLCSQTKKMTHGYFDIEHGGKLDPSGLVKGWSIDEASKKLIDHGLDRFYIEAGGDVQVSGENELKQPWSIGIRNPFDINEIIKVVNLTNQGIATSGTYIRGQHIYNPHNSGAEVDEIKSLTVIGPNVYEADRYATAAFAMGREGINFIDSVPGLEGYMVDNNKVATFTKGFDEFVVAHA